MRFVKGKVLQAPAQGNGWGPWGPMVSAFNISRILFLLFQSPSGRCLHTLHYRTSIIQDIHDEANSSWEFFGLKRDADVITRAPCSYTSCCSLHKSNSNPIKGALLVLWSACQGIQVYTARCATSVLKAVGIEKLMSKILGGTPTVRPATSAF